ASTGAGGRERSPAPRPDVGDHLPYGAVAGVGRRVPRQGAGGSSRSAGHADASGREHPSREARRRRFTAAGERRAWR
ncbi:hypothetical protein, partial [Streptomyces hayashii]|uniref:hypothetical protein n=1 Tax=Streptomyces hayashii TaxID=2839966 RepID=UPI00403CB524